MAGRTRAYWDVRDDALAEGESEGHQYFRYRNELGERVVSYSLYGRFRYAKPDDVRHAFVFEEARPNTQGGLPPRWPQRMSQTPVDLSGIAEEVRAMRADGYFPAYLGVCGPLTSTRYSAIYETSMTGPSPEVILGAPWGSAFGFDHVSFLQKLDEARERGLYARSVGVFGAPKPSDFGVNENASGDPDTTSGLFFVATLWPMPPAGFGWSVQLTPNQKSFLPGAAPAGDEPLPAGPWKNRWETKALATQAHPMAGMMTASHEKYGSLTLMLWHDVRYVRWPAEKGGDPFSEWRSFNFVLREDSQLQAKLDTQRDAHDRRPLSIGASFDGGKAMFFVPLGRAGSEEPWPRRFAKTSKTGTGVYVTAETGPPQYGAARGKELDDWMRARMERIGARHAQLVVVRRGKLVHARAYTLAEEGYPIATLTYALRVASVSKILSAFLTWAKVIPALADGYETLISRSDLLNLTSPRPPLDDVRIAHLLTHNTGFANNIGYQKILDQVVGPVDTSQPGGQAELARRNALGIVEPGMLSKYFQQEPNTDYFDVDPGTSCHFFYVNQNYTLLGECVARLLNTRAEEYATVARDHLLIPCGVVLADLPLYARGWSKAKERNESPGQDPAPGWAWNLFELWNTELPMTSGIYARNGVFEGAAGGWCIPLVWIARVLAGLTDQPSPYPYLSRATMERMASLREPSCDDTNTAYGCARQTKSAYDSTKRLRYKLNRNLGSPDPNAQGSAPKVIRIHHNGQTNGGSALLMHQFPEHPENPLNLPGDAISFCLAFNQGFHEMGESDGEDIFNILQDMEWASPARTFSDQDLFDDL